MLSMSVKSRDNWSTGICLKDCSNKDRKCGDCIRFSNYKPRRSNVRNKIKIKVGL